MKRFFSDHSYDMVKMFLNQFAIGLFGFTLYLVSGQAKSVALRNVTSVGAILFYLFLLYTMTWEIGYRDKVSVEHGKKKRNLGKGALISLCANIPNLIFAIFISLAMFLDVPAISSIGGVCGFLAPVLEGMYTGLLINQVGGAMLNTYWWSYFLLPLPAILTCGVAYVMGIKDLKCTSIFDPIVPESDRDPSERKRKFHD